MNVLCESRKPSVAGEMPRRDFLKLSVAASGGLLIGFYLPGMQPEAQAATFAPNAFVRIGTDDSVTVIVNHSEMGQGVFTALPMILADELDADWAKVHFEPAPVDPIYNHPVYNMQMTGGSTSTWSSFDQFRQAGAAARAMLITAAAQKWNVDAASCRTENGMVIHSASNRRLSYGQLAESAARLTPPQQVTLKDPKDFKLIGQPLKRLDTPEKTNGKGIFGIDVKMPGMLTAVVARSPVFGGKLKSVNADKAKAVKGVRKVVEVPSGLAVIADGFWAAKRGRDVLQIEWDEGPMADFNTKSQREQYAELAKQPGLSARKEGDASGAIGSAAKKIEAVYEVPYLSHAMMEPLNCAVDLRADGCEIWTGTPFESVIVKNGIDGTSVEGLDDIPYAIPNLSVQYHPAKVGVPVLWWRSVGHSHTAFVKESFIDELAVLGGKDPFELRRKLLAKSPRDLGVLELAAEKAGWGKPLPAGRARGIAVPASFESYTAQVAEVSVDSGGKARVHRVVCAVDCGRYVNPGIIEAQVQGAVIFGLTAAFYDELTLEKGRVQQSNFHDYPMLRINETPEIEVHIVKNNEKSGGIGEPGVPCAAPAVANAIFAATGKRIRKLPIRMSEAV